MIKKRGDYEVKLTLLSGEGYDFGSMKCERHFSRVAGGERDCHCLLKQEEDGSPLLTLTLVDGEKKDTYVFDEEQQKLLAEAGLEEVLAQMTQAKG